MKVVAGMIVGCCLLGSIQPYLWAYNPATGRCAVRPNAETLWEYWSWTTELIVFLLVPVLIFVFNVLVMCEVCRISGSGPEVASPPPAAAVLHRSSAEARQSSVPSVAAPKNAATNAMLLTVSFYVIITTLPATLVYVLANVFPEVRPAFHGACAAAAADGATATATSAPDDDDDDVATWRRYVAYQTVKNVVNEICLSHYACNFFFYVATGREFRAALRRLCCRRAAAGAGSSSAEKHRRAGTAAGGAQNGTPQCAQTFLDRNSRPATAGGGGGSEQRTPLVRI